MRSTPRPGSCCRATASHRATGRDAIGTARSRPPHTLSAPAARAAVASAKPLAENTAAVNTNTTTATPKAKVAAPAAAPAAVDDEDDFELESLF